LPKSYDLAFLKSCAAYSYFACSAIMLVKKFNIPARSLSESAILPFSGRSQGSPLRPPRTRCSSNDAGKGRGESCIRPFREFHCFLLFSSRLLGFTPQEFLRYNEFAGVAYVGKHDDGPFVVREFFKENTFPAVKITFIN
jgi:hypothetical protein